MARSSTHAAEQYHVASDRPIRSVVVAQPLGKVPPWFRLFKAVVLNGLVRDMTLADCRVLLCLGSFESAQNGWTVYPAISTIAELTGLQKRAVYNAIARLEELKIVRRDSGGGRASNRYTLLPIAVDKRRGQRVDADALAEELLETVQISEQTEVHADAPVHGDAPLHAAAPVKRRSPMPADAPVQPRAAEHGAPATKTGARPCTRMKKDDLEQPVERAVLLSALSGRTEATAELASRALADRGVAEPQRSRVVAACEPADVLAHALDFDVRRGLPGGSAKSAGWLVASCQVPYDLHAGTLKLVAEAKRSGEADARRAERAAALDAEAGRAAEVERWVQAQFDAADDAELAALKRRALAEYGRLARGLADADPRREPRLGNLVKALLSQMYDGANV